MPITARQQRFVDEYLIDCNATQAAIRAGYSQKTAKQIGSRLLTVVDVSAAIAKRQQRIGERADLNQVWVLDRLRENTERAMQAIPVMEFDRESKTMVETGEYQYEGAVANRAVELIGKHLGMFVERQEHTFPEMTPEDRTNRLAAILNGAREKAKASNGNGAR